MKSESISKLTYRRQYIIAPKEIECPFIFNLIKLNNNYMLYTQKDLLVSEQIKLNSRIILLGDIFGHDLPVKTNSDILLALIDLGLPELIESLERYTGRYVLIFQKGDELTLIHDNIASRKIYYGKIENHMWFASQPYMLGKILNLKETTIPSKQEYYSSIEYKQYDNANIGNTTIYDEIYQLLPNHYFDVNHAKPVRFFPDNAYESLPISDTAKRIADIIKGYMENIAARYSVMLPVTAGKDSRLLLAASKDIKDKLYCYINKGSKLSSKSIDIAIPKSLLPKLGLDFHIIDPFIPVDAEFKRIFHENNKHSAMKYLPIIYNYYINYGDKVNLPGNIAFEAFYKAKFPSIKITPFSLAEITGVERFDFAREYYSGWIDSIQESCKKTNIDILNMFYWEERIANWGTQTQIDKDIAQEEFNPFNSKLLTRLFLSIDYKLLSPPSFVFHKKIIKCLWPEVLQKPINPTLRNQGKKILEFMGLLTFLFKINNLLHSFTHSRKKS